MTNPPQNPWSPQGPGPAQQPATNPYGQPQYGQPQYGQPMQTPYAQPQTAWQPYGGARLTSWPKRVASYIIDVLPYSILSTIADPMLGRTYPWEADTAPRAATNPALGTILMVIALAWLAYNVIWRSGTTGVSIGRQVMGAKLVNESDGQPIGPLKAFVRQLAHLIDTVICLIGFLFPLWDSKRQTIADKICKTLVIDTK